MWATGDVESVPLIGPLMRAGTLADHTVPLAVVGVFAWTMLQAGVRALVVRREHRDVGPPGRPPGRGRINSVKEPTRAARRSRLIRNSFAQSRLHDALPEAAAIDAEVLSNAYTVPHALVWALPVLGFIGTAWGMTHATGTRKNGRRARAAH